MMPTNESTIGIFGSYEPQPGSAEYEQAYQNGFELAKAGFAVLNGGYDGTMAASSKGAKDAGGSTIGVICPTVLIKRGNELQHNSWLDRVIETPDLFARIRTMMDLCNGYVFLQGGTGTLAELGMIWEHVNKGFVPPRPIVIVGGFWNPLVRAIAETRPGAARFLRFADNPERVAVILRNEFAERARERPAEDTRSV